MRKSKFSETQIGECRGWADSSCLVAMRLCCAGRTRRSAVLLDRFALGSCQPLQTNKSLSVVRVSWLAGFKGGVPDPRPPGYELQVKG